jgi:cyclopropane-fatty-acyl-phospholipid synthase
MMYSSAIYQKPDMTLSQAQTAKLALICEKLSLKSTDHLIEIGTGWGGLAIYAATHYGCHVTTTTISDEQYAYAQEQVKALGLADKITLCVTDSSLRNRLASGIEAPINISQCVDQHLPLYI